MRVTLAILMAAVWFRPHEPQPQNGYWGFALAHHPEESRRQGFAYPPDPAPLTGMHANAVLLSPSWEQHDVHASNVVPGETRDVTWRRTIRRSRELGLRVAMAPWVSLKHAEADQWRGVIEPVNRAAWWQSYRRFVLHYAQLASEERVELFAVGSELSSRDDDAEWGELIAEVREVYAGSLAFVANHDALDPVAFEHVDVLGVSAYFPVHGSWEHHAQRLRQLHEEHDKPLVIFEVGFASRRGALREPWNNTTGAPVDLEAQARGYELVTEALGDAAWLHGVFFWTWFGPGGEHDRHYTPRGKPAESIARSFLSRRVLAAPLGSGRGRL